ncbi:6-carboxyhexanoate--CoA ligase [Trichinella pseudospiralis]
MGSLTSTRPICTLTVSGAGGALASMANQRWAHFLLRNQTNHRRGDANPYRRRVDRVTSDHRSISSSLAGAFPIMQPHRSVLLSHVTVAQRFRFHLLISNVAFQW